MIDNFALALTHVLLAVALWRILLRDDLDRDPDDPAGPPNLARRLPSRPQDSARDPDPGARKAKPAARKAGPAAQQD